MKRGQSLAEYAFVFAVVIGALALMQRPMRNLVLGKTFAQAISLCDRACLEGDEENCDCRTGAQTRKRNTQDSLTYSNGTERVTLSPGAKVDRTWDISTNIQTAPPEGFWFEGLFAMRQRGQSALEYGIFFTIAVLALAAMTPYARRCISGAIRKASSEISDKHYDAHATSGTSVMQYTDQTTTFIKVGSSQESGERKTRQSGNEDLEAIAP